MRDPETTVIGPGVRVNGDIAGDGDVEVYGSFEGAVHIGGELRIYAGGVAVAEVVAARVRVDGRLEGRVRATQQVAIGTEGCLVGNVQGLLAVEEGGVFKGRVDVEFDLPEPPPINPSEPGATPRRLLRPASQPILRLPTKERSPTEPSAQRGSVGDISDEHRAARRPARRLQRPSLGKEDLTTRPMPAVARGPSGTVETPAHRPSVAPAPEDLDPPDAVSLPRVARAGPSRPITASSPKPKRAAAKPQAKRTETSKPKKRSRPKPGDPVKDRADLTDEWFVLEDEVLPGAG